MNKNYYFIDGSALLAQIRQLRRVNPSFDGRKLCPKRYLDYLNSKLEDIVGDSWKRAIFYFPVGDEASIGEYLEMPNHLNPGEVRDFGFKFCGSKLKKSAEFDKFVEESVPSKFQSRFSKSEKGIDTEICCDALRLASRNQIERLILLTNDSDFIPLCRTLKEFGANISVIHLSRNVTANSDLLQEADSYDVVEDDALNELFIPVVEIADAGPLYNVESLTPEGTMSEKPDSDAIGLKEVGIKPILENEGPPKEEAGSK